MITKLEKPIMMTRDEIDEKYSGKYIAWQREEGIFDEGLVFAIATENTNEAWKELNDYGKTYYKETQKFFNIALAGVNRWGDDLHAVITNVQRVDIE